MSQRPNRTKRVPQKDPGPLFQSDSAKSALSASAAPIKTGQSVTGISSLVVLTEGKTRLKWKGISKAGPTAGHPLKKDSAMQAALLALQEEKQEVLRICPWR